MSAAPLLPQNYIAATRAVALCASVDECKDWVAKATAIAAYARMAHNTQMEEDAKRIRFRAVRRMGELIGPDGRASRVFGPGRGNSRPNPAAATLTFEERRTARAIARMPEPRFKEHIEHPRSFNKLLREAESPKASQSEKHRDHFHGLIINGQPLGNLTWREVRGWAQRQKALCLALIALADEHDQERTIGDCIDDSAFDTMLAKMQQVE